MATYSNIVRKYGVFASTLHVVGAAVHRWWTNVLLKERCTRLGSRTAQQCASYAADGLKSSHRQTRSWQTWLLPIKLWCNATWRAGHTWFIAYSAPFVAETLAKSFHTLIGIDQSSFDMALLILNNKVSLFRHHRLKLNRRGAAVGFLEACHFLGSGGEGVRGL